MNVETEKNMVGKVILISGGTGGIGRETALALAKMGAQITLIGRNPTKAVQTAEMIRQESGNQAIDFLVGDLSSQADIRRIADEFRARHNRLDVLINNAGAVFLNPQKSVDGIGMTFALNHLNYFLLTNLLLDLIKASAPARIINVSSAAHIGGKMNFDDLQVDEGFGGWKAYSQSKLANILFTYELARRLEGTGVTVNALHPGFVATNFGISNGGLFGPLFKLVQFAAISPEEGAQTTIYLASSRDVQSVTGQYFSKKKPVRSSPATYRAEDAALLWQQSLRLTGLAEEATQSAWASGDD